MRPSIPPLYSMSVANSLHQYVPVKSPTCCDNQAIAKGDRHAQRRRTASWTCPPGKRGCRCFWTYCAGGPDPHSECSPTTTTNPPRPLRRVGSRKHRGRWKWASPVAGMIASIVEGHSAGLLAGGEGHRGEARLETGSREGFSDLRLKMPTLSMPLGIPLAGHSRGHGVTLRRR